MSNRATGKTFRTTAIVAVLASATALSGCSSLSGLGFDRTATGSVNAAAQPASLQPMPGTLTPPSRYAANQFVPPADIGGGGGQGGPMLVGSAPADFRPQGSVTTQDLPVLTSSANGINPMMPAAQSLSQDATVKPLKVPTSDANAATLVSVPSDAYVHVIESGESLYTIARRYNVTAQAIIQANGFSSPDKIFVGQKVVIPGRSAKPGSPSGTAVASGPTPALVPPAQRPTQVADVAPELRTPAAKPALVQQPVAEAKPAAPATLEQPKVEQANTGAEKFRWPISGRVITDFANSKGTGINIEAPEGAAVRAAENGQVIYAGSGVEGYGNLILIRHPNGYVSAYAHLRDMTVAKGTVVNRGDNIGSAGKTGSVSKPQLHFELRKGATPVDPIPLLAS